ncbi:MAG: hypothetical protein AAF725_02910, partial [Acidobacteriota bacterium]
MKVRLPTIVQDPASTEIAGKTENFEVREDEEDVFLDGPVSRRVAVIDFDEKTGLPRPGVVFEPPAPGRTLAGYPLADPHDYTARDFNAVSVFATVLRTLRLFESADCLGRRLEWGFGGPQLLVVPRAGLRANAFYSRDSRSLQFFFFPSSVPEHEGRTIYTSLSHDIVAHETGHAILDGIAPDLYDALTPQSLALHEAIADLTALLMAYGSRTLAASVLEKTRGSIDRPSDFSWLAEEFASAKDGGRSGYLRSLDNQKTFDSEDRSRDAHGRRNFVRERADPHRQSQVLTGALYPAMLALFDHYRQAEQEETGKTSYSVSGKALAVAAQHFKRVVLRGLDYLPPGEVSFADYARAILASDEAYYASDRPAVRQQIRDELVRRRVVASARDLEVATNVDPEEHPSIGELDLDRLVESDWAAYDFVDRHRELLGVPPGVPFHVKPRQKVRKVYFRGGRRVPKRECLLKVSWDVREPNGGAPEVASERQITAGTTLALAWSSRHAPRIRALLRSDASKPETDAAGEQRADRDLMMRSLVESEERPGGDAHDSATLRLER